MAAPLASFAQKKPAKAYRIGVLHGGSPASAAAFGELFKQGPRELGYAEGQNVIPERRYGEGKAERGGARLQAVIRRSVKRRE